MKINKIWTLQKKVFYSFFHVNHREYNFSQPVDRFL
jgi:hypothetical protein